MTVSSLVSRSMSLSAQLLLTLVMLVAATVTALTLVAYDSSIDNLLELALRDARLIARGRAELVTQLLDLRERRAAGFLAAAEKVCAEPAGRSWFGWAEPCAEDFITEYRATEGALGAVLTFDGARVTAAGEPVEGAPPEGRTWSIAQDTGGIRYLLRAGRGGAELRLEFDDSDIQSTFDVPDLGSTRRVFLLSDDARPLTPAGDGDEADYVGALARCRGQAGHGDPVSTVEFGGRTVIEESVPLGILPGACVVAHVDYQETREPAAQLRKELVWRGVTFVLGGVLLSLMAARHIAGPVRRLAASARALQSGDFGTRVPVAGPSEVQALGQALSAMSHDLADLVAREQAGRREAEAANRSKDQFLAMLSHELRTPLTAVLGWAHTLRAAAEDPQRVRRAASAIARSAEAQRRLIEDLLDVAGIAAGRVRMAPAPTTLDAVIDAALDAVAPQADEKGVQLRTSIEDAGLVVYADPQRLQQIVWNLAWNAVKYTPSGGQVHVRVRATGRLAELAVSDTGMGIDPEFLPHVFGWFRREEGAPLPAHEGLGLGLALVRQLVELHGGSVRAESAGRGQGSTFIVSFPLHDDASGGAPPRPAESSVSLASIRVLVVDDDPGSREAVRVLLEQVGAQVVTAASAADARRHVRAEPLDVIVSDIAMSQESGYSLLETLRAEGFTVPGIALTGYARREDADKAYAAGFDVHLPKPVDPDVLVNVLAAVTRREVVDGPPAGER